MQHLVVYTDKFIYVLNGAISRKTATFILPLAQKVMCISITGKKTSLLTLHDKVAKMKSAMRIRRVVAAACNGKGKEAFHNRHKAKPDLRFSRL
jgi:hypothetical protein